MTDEMRAYVAFKALMHQQLDTDNVQMDELMAAYCRCLPPASKLREQPFGDLQSCLKELVNVELEQAQAKRAELGEA